MSKGKKRREQERRIRRARREMAAWRDVEGEEADGLTAPRRPEDVVLVSYDITLEPLEHMEAANRRVSEALGGEEEHQKLHDLLYEDPKAAIPVLERLIAQLDNAPMLYNWLSTAYGATGDEENSDRIARLNYERNPEYLFAKVNFAQMCLRDGDVKRVAEIFDNKFDLKLLYPHRNVFHLTEYVGFSAVMVEYYMRTGNQEAAKILLKTMTGLAPDHPATEHARRQVEGSVLMKALRHLVARSMRRGTLAGW
jgi:hypothetical protein